MYHGISHKSVEACINYAWAAAAIEMTYRALVPAGAAPLRGWDPGLDVRNAVTTDGIGSAATPKSLLTGSVSTLVPP